MACIQCFLRHRLCSNASQICDFPFYKLARPSLGVSFECDRQSDVSVRFLYIKNSKELFFG